ncbi:MAG: class I SAM-dependent methyltransferase [Candidatus Peregrinibacteria bacterium]
MLPPSPFLTDLAGRIYQMPFPDCANSEQIPLLGSSFQPAVQRWLESDRDPVLADLLQETRDLGLPLIKIPVLVRYAANLFLLASEGRQKLDETLQGDHLLSLSGYTPPPDYDREHQTRKRSFIRQDTPNKIIEHFARHSHLDGISLAVDVGTGNGRDVIALVQHGVRRVIGLDSSITAVKQARCRVMSQLNGDAERVKIRQGTLEDLVARDTTLIGNVDAVTATSVFHLSPPGYLSHLLKSVRFLLRENGVLAIQQKTPRSPFNSPGKSVCLERGAGYTSRLCQDGHPRYFMEPATLQQNLEAAGFEVDLLEIETLPYDTDSPDEFACAIARSLP